MYTIVLDYNWEKVAINNFMNPITMQWKKGDNIKLKVKLKVLMVATA